MRKATENQGNPRTFTEYLMPRSKVKDFTLQQSSLPHVTSFYQETPMKPSQVPNWLFHPPPRRMLPLQSPEQCHRDRLGPPQPSPRPAGPVHSSVPNSPVNFGSWVNRPLPPSSPGRLQHSGQSPGPIYSSQLSPVSPTNIGASYNGPQPSSPTIFNPASPYSRKDVSSHSDIRRDQVTANMVTLSNSGTKNATVQQQESTKAQSNDIRSPIQTIQLHRPPTTLSVATRTVKDVCSQRDCQPSTSDQSSDRSSGSCSPMMHSPAPPYQDQHHRRTPSNETFIPVVDLNCTSQKRNREPEDCDDTAKKLCLQAAHSGIAQTPKPTVANSLSSSLVAPSRNTDAHLRAEPACGQTCLEQSSTFKPNQSSCASPSPKPCVKRQTPMMAQQVFLNHSENHVVKVTDLRADREILMKIGEENDRGCKSSTLLSSEVPQKHAGSSSHAQLGSHYSCHTQNNTSASPVRTHNRVQQIEESRTLDNNTLKPASKSNSGSLTCRSVERNKMIRPRKPVVLPNDIDELFTPDPKTYVVIPTHKNAKPKVDVGPIQSPSEKSCSSNAVVISSAPVTGSLCHKAQTSTATGSPHAEVTTISFSSAHCPQILLPAVSLERVKLENLMSFCPKDSKLKNSSITSLSSQLKDKSAKTDEKHKSHLPNDMRPCALKTDTAASEQTYTSCCFPSAPLEKEASEGDREQVNKEDPIDVELDLGLSFALDLDLTQSSHSSDEEQLLSFQEIMDRVTKPPDTPEKGAFSEPSTPGHHSCQSKTLPLPSTAKSVIYKNNLDQMLKEINTNKKAKEIEMQLLTACKEDLLRIAEYEEAEEEEGISTEQQEFLQRYSLMSSAIKEVPPGEVVFNLQKFGQIFNQDTLELRRCMANPQGAAQKTLLWSSSAQFRLHVNIGLFQEAYNYHSPCPTQVTRFLFKMMSVHTERMVSEKILQALCDIACTAACQIVEKRSQLFKVWVPSLADVTLVLMNMGVAFVTLFPFENLQPPFTEGELLEDVYIKRESPSSNKEQDTFPEHNCNNILKYLHYCMGLCPRAYSDVELLLLLTVVCRMGLDTRLILRSRVDFYPLQHKIVNNIRHWDTMLPRICLALTDLTCDHHNMCLLVQLLPDNTRGKQLRRHLSLSMISKLLDGTCTYRPTEKELQLCELRPYLHRMQPSTLLRGMLSSSSRSQKEKDEDMAILDQQAYYLCYSLLTLANEASDFPFFPAQQKKHLLSLCSELETHVKCDIRESEKCLYRSKVKDLVARIYTKWQMLLQRTRPLNGKLYDYWEPPVETLTSSQEEQETDNSDDEEGKVIEENPAMEDDEEKETSGVEENVVSMVPEEEEEEEEKKGGDTIDDTNKTEDNMTQDERLEGMEGCKTINNTNKTEDGMTQDERLEDIEGGDAINDTSETDKAIEPVPEALMDEKIDTDNTESEHLGEKKNFSP